MSPEMLLAELRAQGATLAIDGDQVVIDAPAGVLTPELLADLRGHKPEVLGLLAREEAENFWEPGILRARFIKDPRPDLEGDSNLWSRLLTLAYGHDGEDPNGLFGVLHGFRCSGAGLTVVDGRAHLVAGEMGDEYPAERERWLDTHAPALAALLDDLVLPPARVA